VVVLNTTGRSNVLSDSKIDENIVLGGVGLWIETTDDSKATTIVEIISNGTKTSLKTGKRESLAGDVVGFGAFAY
jgi:hypothetical protein